MSFKLVKLRNMRYFQNMKKREFYAIHKKIGTYNHKPLFIAIYPYPITLEVTGSRLFWDSESLYNYVNVATKGNLTQMGDKFNMMEFIQKNFIVILIIVGLVIFLSTPDGQRILQELISGK